MITITNNVWAIETELTLNTVSTVHKNFKNQLQKLSDTWIIDFSKCNKVDSSGLSLIIEYIKYSKSKNLELKLKNINEKTLSLAKIHGAENILEKFID